MLRLALAGLNIGIDGGTDHSGERAAIKSVLRSVSGTPTLLDVGANKGDYTAELLNATASRATIHCFEPSQTASRTLRHRFGSHPAVTIHNVGLSDRDESTELYADQPGSPLGSVLARHLQHVALSLRPVETIELRRLDRVVRDLGISRIDLLKLDVEGLELAALHGAGELLTNGCVRNIQFEFGGCNIDSRTFFRDFWELLSPNYRLYRVVFDGLAPIERYDERLEQFVTTNYIAARI